MYSIDLNAISLEEFAKTLVSVELLPSRRVLADHIERIVPTLRDLGVKDLADLKGELRNKKRYPELARALDVDEQYVVLLNREVNSYQSKPIPLANLDVFTAAELDALAAAGIASTKHFYERCAARADREILIVELELDETRVGRALALSNLVRINGVGPAFAHFLLGLGVRGPQAFLEATSAEVLARYEREAGSDAVKLRIEDLEYIRRYSRGLASDIEW